jgi:hypothetical protein
MLPADYPCFFCGLPFRAHQVRKKLRWLLGAGEIRQLIKDVYVDVRVPDSRELRAGAVTLLVPPGSTACGQTAAWIHGIEPVRSCARHGRAGQVLKPVWMWSWWVLSEK